MLAHICVGQQDASLPFQIWNLESQIPALEPSTPPAPMTYQRFEDLPVWQKAAELYELMEDLL